MEIQHQENIISKQCEEVYKQWKDTKHSQLKSNFNISSSEVSSDGKFVVGPVGEGGGYMELRNGDVQLLIPPGSMPQQREGYGYVFMYLDTVEYNTEKHYVIICGPPGIRFSSSIILRFPNLKQNGGLLYEQMHTRIKLSVQKLGEPMKWRPYDTSSDGLCCIEESAVILHLNHFTGIKFDSGVQTISEGNTPIYVSAFLEKNTQNTFTFRVFCSTYYALRNLKDEEQGSSQALGKPVKVGSYNSSDEVNFRITDCVECKTKPLEYMICVSDVFSDMGYIHRQFLVDCSISDAFLTFEVTIGGKTVHIAQVQTNRCYDTAADFKQQESLDKYMEVQFSPSPVNPPILSQNVRCSLSIQLDVLRESQRQDETELRLCDYRGLAQLMNISGDQITWMGPEAPKNCPTDSSPTILVLNRWELNCRRRKLNTTAALCELKSLLQQLDHNACVKIINEYIKEQVKKNATRSHRARFRSLSESIL
ncbi:uncharacterized protein [Antedon mediterranea]|uniref:uncharacterized protein n=1 Tax=Antedon mediterranea TaxID=105859 RepID=UPI003AF92F75